MKHKDFMEHELNFANLTRNPLINLAKDETAEKYKDENKNCKSEKMKLK